MLNASRILPSDLTAIASTDSRSELIFSLDRIEFTDSLISFIDIRLKSKRWQREIIVSGTL